MKSFKKLAYQILKDAKKSLHSNEITRRALKLGLVTDGKTPERTMHALLLTDINKNGSKSLFIKTGASVFGLNKNVKETKIQGKLFDNACSISSTLSPKQKGDIGEGRIAELIVLYGNGLSCYKPISDDDGIDIIVKKKQSKKIFFIQVKTRFGTSKNTSLTTHIKKNNIMINKSTGLVFCFFDEEKGDIWDYLWFIPAKDFVKLAKITNNKKFGPIYRFVAGRKHRESNKWDKYLIDKCDLANKIIKHMESNR